VKKCPSIILQRVIPHYRRAFFEAVNERYGWRVVVAENPPPETFLNVLDPKDLSFADTFPMRFSKDGESCYLNTSALIATFNPPAILCEFSMRMQSSYSLPFARRFGSLERLAFWTQGWSSHRPFRSFADYVSHFGRLPLFAGADHILTYSEEGALWVRRHLKHSKVSALSNTIDNTEIRAALLANVLPEVREPLSFLSVGRLTLDKSYDRLISIFKMIVQTNPGAKLTIIGDGPDRERLVALSGDQLGKSIFMLGALHNEEDLAPYFLGADLFLLAGAAGLSINHSLNYGLPVVAFPRSRSGPFHHPEIEYLIHGRTGWLAEDYTEEAFIRAVFSASSHFKDKTTREAILDFAENKISLDAMLDNFGRFVELLWD